MTKELILKVLLLLALVYVIIVGYRFTWISPKEKAERLKTKTDVFLYMVLPTVFFLITSIIAIHQKVILLEHAWYLLIPCLVLAVLLPDMWASHKRACAKACALNGQSKVTVEAPEESKVTDALDDFLSSDPVKETDKNFDGLEFEFDDDLDDAIAKHKARQDSQLGALFREVTIHDVLFAEFLDTETDLEYKDWVIRRLKRVKVINEAFDEWIGNDNQAEKEREQKEEEQEEQEATKHLSKAA